MPYLYRTLTDVSNYKIMVNSYFFGLSLLCLALTVEQSLAQNNQTPSKFDHIEKVLFKSPYSELPSYKINRKLFGKAGNHAQNKLLADARRTLQDQRDLIKFPTGQKLLQANGICFVGQWHIDQANEYTGLFSTNTISPVIVRASVALNGTRQKDKRAFGMALKFFPFEIGNQASLNVFVMNSMGGVVSQHILDLSMDNQPPLGRLPNWRQLSTALRLRRDLQQADRETGSQKPNFAFRPIDHLAKYQQLKNVVSPKWLRLTAHTTTRVDVDDFRDELRVEHYPKQQLIYNIDVAASNHSSKAKANWQSIGKLTLTKSITSGPCDRELHFMHPSLN